MSPLAKKHLGQHFLKDKNVISKITSAYIDKATSIIEIGPGPGALTQELQKLDLPLWVIEKDKRFAEQWKQQLGEDFVHFGDALKVKLNDFARENNVPTPIWLVSNLPYNVASPLIINFLTISEIKWMTLMMQKEVGEKILPPRAKSSSLQMLCQNYFKVSKLLKVSPGAFHPPPKVDSLVLNFERHPHPVIPVSDFVPFEKFVRTLYGAKRKQLGGHIKRSWGEEIFNRALETISADTRAEDLNFQQVTKLYEIMTS